MTRFSGSDVPCAACQHDQAQHQPDCQAVLGASMDGVTFCACSRYRAAEFRPSRAWMTQWEAEARAQRRREIDERMPAWTAEARCRSAALGGIGPNTPGNLYPEAYSDDLADQEELNLPEASVLDFMENACLPCPVRMACLHYAYAEVDRKRRYGIYGGVPGRIRARMSPDVANEWFLSLAEAKGWTHADRQEGAIA